MPATFPGLPRSASACAAFPLSMIVDPAASTGLRAQSPAARAPKLPVKE